MKPTSGTDFADQYTLVGHLNYYYRYFALFWCKNVYGFKKIYYNNSKEWQKCYIEQCCSKIIGWYLVVIHIKKYNRIEIAAISSAQSVCPLKNRNVYNAKRVAVPEKDTFEYIFKNAKKGNEMAAVLLYEWQRSCKPKDKKEERIIKYINKATNRIFV